MGNGILDNINNVKTEIIEDTKIEIPKNAFDIVTETNLYEILDWEYETGKTIKIRVEMLSFDKHRECRKKAKEAVEGSGIFENTFLWDSEYQQELNIYILWNCLKNTESDSRGFYPNAFSTPSGIRKLNPAQIESLLNLYEYARQRLSISEETLFIEENVEAWVSAISTAIDNDAKKALARLSFADLVEICAILCKTVHRSISSTLTQSQDTLELNQKMLSQDIVSFASPPEDGMMEKSEKTINKQKLRKKAIKDKSIKQK